MKERESNWKKDKQTEWKTNRLKERQLDWNKDSRTEQKTNLFRWFLWQLLNCDPVETLFSLVFRLVDGSLLAAFTFVADFFVVFRRWGRRRRRRRWKIRWKWGVWVDWWGCGRTGILEFALKKKKIYRKLLNVFNYLFSEIRCSSSAFLFP